jgi:hypothetical protein
MVAWELGVSVRGSEPPPSGFCAHRPPVRFLRPPEHPLYLRLQASQAHESSMQAMARAHLGRREVAGAQGGRGWSNRRAYPGVSDLAQGGGRALSQPSSSLEHLGMPWKKYGVDYIFTFGWSYRLLVNQSGWFLHHARSGTQRCPAPSIGPIGAQLGMIMNLSENPSFWVQKVLKCLVWKILG